jgi:hypothetical protein
MEEFTLNLEIKSICEALEKIRAAKLEEKGAFKKKLLLKEVNQ